MDRTAPPQHRVQITAHGATATVEIDGEQVAFRAVGACTVSRLAGVPARGVLHLADREDARFSGMARVSGADSSIRARLLLLS